MAEGENGGDRYCTFLAASMYRYEGLYLLHQQGHIANYYNAFFYANAKIYFHTTRWQASVTHSSKAGTYATNQDSNSLSFP